MNNRNSSACCDLGDAADISGRNQIRRNLLDMRDFAITQPLCQFGLQKVIGSRRPTTDVTLRNILDGETCLDEKRTRGDSLTMLQRAGGMV